MEHLKLTIEVAQHPLGHFELSGLTGPLADKMLCYAMIAAAQHGEYCHKPIEKAAAEDPFRLTLEVRRDPTSGELKPALMTGPRDKFFVRGMLGLARDGVQAGISKAAKVKM